MKYYLLETAPWEIFYSAAAETTETIVNEFVSAYADYTKAEKFDKTKHQPAKHTSGVKNDENIYILYRITGEPELWQIGSKVSDIAGYIVPGLFHVRKIGVFVSDSGDVNFVDAKRLHIWKDKDFLIEGKLSEDKKDYVFTVYIPEWSENGLPDED